MWRTASLVIILSLTDTSKANEDVTVTCSFTVDDQVVGVFYNGLPLNVAGFVYNWRAMKTVTFQPGDVDDGYGELEIEGRDRNSDDDPHCTWGGLLLLCQASDDNSPWHNFTSNTGQHWKAKDGSELCSDEGGMVAEFLRTEDADDKLPFMDLMLKSGSKKIWTDKQEVTFFGTPHPEGPSAYDEAKWRNVDMRPEVKQDLPKEKYLHLPEGHDMVTCSLSVDDEIIKIYYNGKPLSVTGKSGWFNENKITFQTDAFGFGELTIEGVDHNIENDHCKLGGLLLLCETPSNFNSPWHNFKSDLKNWRAKDGSKLCLGNINESIDKDFMKRMTRIGAKKIWADMHKVTLVGSPGTCKGLAPWNTVLGMDGWCNLNCSKGNCPPSHCKC